MVGGGVNRGVKGGMLRSTGGFLPGRRHLQPGGKPQLGHRTVVSPPSILMLTPVSPGISQ